MGYRAHLVKKMEVEYGSEIGEFNYNPNLCEYCLKILNQEYSRFEDDTFEISVNSILQSAKQKIDYAKIISENEFEGTFLHDKEINMPDMLEKFHEQLIEATKTEFAKKTDYVRLEFF